jgi:hypothetical protein
VTVQIEGPLTRETPSPAPKKGLPPIVKTIAILAVLAIMGILVKVLVFGVLASHTSTNKCKVNDSTTLLACQGQAAPQPVNRAVAAPEASLPVEAPSVAEPLPTQAAPQPRPQTAFDSATLSRWANLVDKAYPGYQAPLPLHADGAQLQNFFNKFLTSQELAFGVTTDPFLLPKSSDHLVLISGSWTHDEGDVDHWQFNGIADPAGSSTSHQMRLDVTAVGIPNSKVGLTWRLTVAR